MLVTKITNQAKFDQVSEVEFSSKSIYKGAIDGNVYIQLNNGQEIDSTGQHSVRAFEEDFGFVIVEKD